MAEFRLAVRTRPLPGREAEYHEWYDGFHLEEVLRVPGFVAAERFAPLPDGVGAGIAGDGDHLAVFTVESEDIAATVAAFRAAQRTMAEPPCLDPDSVVLTWWQPLGHRRTRSSPANTPGA